MQAVFQGTVIAESDDTIAVEDNHYFPEDSLRSEHFRPSSTRTVCPWKGRARPWSLARRIKGRVAFRHGVEVRPGVSGEQQSGVV